MEFVLRALGCGLAGVDLVGVDLLGGSEYAVRTWNSDGCPYSLLFW